MDNRPIGIFDSGIGGLTSVREFSKILPDEDGHCLRFDFLVQAGSHQLTSDHLK